MKEVVKTSKGSILWCSKTVFWTWYIVSGNQGAEKEEHEKRKILEVAIETKRVKSWETKKKKVDVAEAADD